MKRLLTEVYHQSATLIEESLSEDSPKQLYIEGLVQEAEVENQNHRVYPLSVLEREVAKYQPMIESGHNETAMLLDHPGKDSSPSAERIAGKLVKLWMEGNKVKAKIQVVETRSGQDLKAIVKSGLKIGFSSRGEGTTKTETVEGRQRDRVNEDFVLRGFDFVVGQSLAGAHMDKHVEEQKQGGSEMDPTKLTLESLKAEFPEVYKNLCEELNGQYKVRFQEDMKLHCETIEKKLREEMGTNEAPSVGNAYVATLDKVVAFLKAKFGMTLDTSDPDEGKRQGSPAGSSSIPNMDKGGGLDASATEAALRDSQKSLMEEIVKMRQELEQEKIEKALLEKLANRSETEKKYITSRVLPIAKTLTEALELLDKEAKELDDVIKANQVKPIGKGASFISETKSIDSAKQEARRLAGLPAKK